MSLDLAILSENFDVVHFTAALNASFGANDFAACPVADRFDRLRQGHAVGLRDVEPILALILDMLRFEHLFKIQVSASGFSSGPEDKPTMHPNSSRIGTHSRSGAMSFEDMRFEPCPVKPSGAAKHLYRVGAIH